MTNDEAETEYSLELWQGGVMVAAVTAPDKDRAVSEIMHYAMMYGQDGPVEVRTPAK